MPFIFPPGGSASVTVVSASGPIVAPGIYLVDASGGAVVLNIDLAANFMAGSVTVLKTDASANTVTIDANGAETINGATTKVLDLRYQGFSMVSDKVSAWYGDFFGVMSSGWSVSNVTPDTSYNANATSLDEQADVSGTLITALLNKGKLSS